jgi:tRNA pseudouridine32 synthase/23S rRNA pseudouridine746 synthase
MSDRKDHAEAHVVIESPDDRPIDLLGQATGLSKQRIKLAMTQGAVSRGRNTRRLRRAKRALRAGDELHLYYDAAILAEVPPEPNLVADIGAYSVWCKPRGLLEVG